MPAFNDLKAPGPKAGWFSRLYGRPNALLLAFGALTFLLELHGLHSGEPVTVMAGRSDWSDSSFWSAATFVLAACLLAVALGWKPERSNPQLRK